MKALACARPTAGHGAGGDRAEPGVNSRLQKNKPVIAITPVLQKDNTANQAVTGGKGRWPCWEFNHLTLKKRSHQYGTVTLQE